MWVVQSDTLCETVFPFFLTILFLAVHPLFSIKPLKLSGLLLGRVVLIFDDNILGPVFSLDLICCCCCLFLFVCVCVFPVFIGFFGVQYFFFLLNFFNAYFVLVGPSSVSRLGFVLVRFLCLILVHLKPHLL